MKTSLKKTKKRIQRITAALESQLGLDGWVQITHHFVEGYDGDTETDDAGTVTVYRTVAVTTPLWEYRVCKITWYLSSAIHQTDEELEQIAIHEYIHYLLSPVTTLLPKADYNGKMEEFVTENLMRFIGHGMGKDNVH